MVFEYGTLVLVASNGVLVLDMFMVVVVLVRFESTELETLAEVVYVGLEYEVGHVRVSL